MTTTLTTTVSHQQKVAAQQSILINGKSAKNPSTAWLSALIGATRP